MAFNLYPTQIFLLNLGIIIDMPNSFILIFFIHHVCSNKSSYLYWHQLIYIISNLKLIPFSWKRLRHPFFSHFQCFYPIANPIWSELDQSSSAHKTVGSLKQHSRRARARELYPVTSNIVPIFLYNFLWNEFSKKCDKTSNSMTLKCSKLGLDVSFLC